MWAFSTSPSLPPPRRSQRRNVTPFAPPRARRVTPTAKLTNVLVVGANRGLGLEVAALLHDKGVHHITTTRREQSFCPPTLGALSTAVHFLDALDRETAAALIQNCAPEVVISCLGGSIPDGVYPDFRGNKNLIDAAESVGVKRFVMISALGAGDSEGSVPFQVMDTMRPLFLEKSHAEAYLRASDIQWTIVRPGPIVDGQATGTAVATEGTICYGTVTREDLAKVVVAAAESEGAAGKTLHIVDRKKILITSPYVRPLEFWEPLPFEEFPL